MIQTTYTLEELNNLCKNTIAAHIGIEFTGIGDQYISAKMPVDTRTQQPFGLLHGGASVVLAETLGSIASFLSLKDQTKQRTVGLEINANHLRSVKDGYVYGKATPLHVGRSTQVWEIKITDEQDRLVCVSRITIAVIDVPAS